MKNSFFLVVLLSLITVLPLSAAENRPVASASSVHSAPFVAFLAVDGDSRTRWASKAGGKEWIQIDFGKSCEIDDVKIVWEAAYAEDYQIQVSGDTKNWRVLYQTPIRTSPKSYSVRLESGEYNSYRQRPWSISCIGSRQRRFSKIGHRGRHG